MYLTKYAINFAPELTTNEGLYHQEDVDWNADQVWCEWPEGEIPRRVLLFNTAEEAQKEIDDDPEYHAEDSVCDYYITEEDFNKYYPDLVAGMSK